MPKHVSVLIPNQPARLQEIAELLKSCVPPVNIWAYHVANAGRTSILQMVCVPHQVAVRALTGMYGNFVSEAEILAIKVPNKPGQLYELLRLLDGRHLVSSYQTLDIDGQAVIVMEFGAKSDIRDASEAIANSGYQLMDNLAEG